MTDTMGEDNLSDLLSTANYQRAKSKTVSKFHTNNDIDHKIVGINQRMDKFENQFKDQKNNYLKEIKKLQREN